VGGRGGVKAPGECKNDAENEKISIHEIHGEGGKGEKGGKLNGELGGVEKPGLKLQRCILKKEGRRWGGKDGECSTLTYWVGRV